MNTRLAQLSARVPRYTSYPTAPHFHAGVDHETYAGWLRALPPYSPLSAYVHIPFCDTLCWFCACHTRVVNNYGPLKSYLALLSREIAHVAETIGSRREISHLHWGGGSPTMLADDDIIRLADDLKSRFPLSANAEFAIEIDPRGLKIGTIAALASSGVNRASIGVQDCDAKVQKAINRIQPFDETKTVIESLRDHGIHAINIDLIYGLPHQTTEGIKRTIDAVLTLEPDRLAVFGYAHVPHFKKHQELIEQAALPGIAERLEQFEAMQDSLTAAGYVAIGIDHFARPDDSMAVAQRSGALARNFQGYTVDSAPALIGFGASAIGALPQGYVQNETDVPNYRKAIESGRLPIAKGVALNDDDRTRRAVIERLMCDLEVDLEAECARFGEHATKFTAELDALEPLKREGVVEVSGSMLRVPKQARSHVRLVAAAFDSRLKASGARHALAV